MHFKKICISFLILLLTGCSANVKTLTVMPSAKGKMAYVSFRDGNFEIHLMNTDGSNQENLTNNPANDLQPVWSPDGKEIAFSSDREGQLEIYVMNADGSQQTRLTHTKTGALNPIWSPDGEYIIYLSEQDGVLSDRGIPTSEVYIMKSDGSEQKRITNNQDFERELSWAPEGDVIAVSANIRTPSGIYIPDEIYLMGLDGLFKKSLTENFPNNTHPAWSPNSQFIAFSSTRDGSSEIYVMNADGSDQTRLTISPIGSVYNLSPSWSSDGRYIIFSSNRDGNYNIYRIKTDGSGLTRLTNAPWDETSPVWSP